MTTALTRNLFLGLLFFHWPSFSDEKEKLPLEGVMMDDTRSVYKNEGEFIYLDGSMPILPYGTSVTLVEQKGKHFKYRCSNSVGDRCWIEEGSFLPKQKVTASAVSADNIAVYSDSSGAKKDASIKLMASDFVLTTEKSGKFCKMMLRKKISVWVRCEDLLTDSEHVRAANLISIVNLLKDDYDFDRAIEKIESVQKESKLPWLTKLTDQLPTLKTKKVEKDKAMADPDYQECVSPDYVLEKP